MPPTISLVAQTAQALKHIPSTVYPHGSYKDDLDTLQRSIEDVMNRMTTNVPGRQLLPLKLVEILFDGKLAQQISSTLPPMTFEKLRGKENYFSWRRNMLSYLSSNGSDDTLLKIINGTSTEPKKDHILPTHESLCASNSELSKGQRAKIIKKRTEEMKGALEELQKEKAIWQEQDAKAKKIIVEATEPSLHDCIGFLDLTTSTSMWLFLELHCKSSGYVARSALFAEFHGTVLDAPEGRAYANKITTIAEELEA